MYDSDHQGHFYRYIDNTISSEEKLSCSTLVYLDED